MKKYIVLLGALVCICIAATAQQQSEYPTLEEIKKWLPGTWVVQDKALLPITEDGNVEFLKDSLIFSAYETREFKNGTKPQPAKIYEYAEDEGLMVILDVKQMDGVEYQVKSLSPDKLVFMSVYPGKLELTELVYVKQPTK